MTTFAHEVVPEIDLTNELGKKCVAALLPREGSGNFIKEVVSGEMLEFSGGITWNGDSVSAQTDGSYNNSTPLTENPLQDVDLATENFMVAVDVDVAALGTGSKNQDFFSAITGVQGSAVTLGAESWNNYLGFNNNRKWVSAYKASSAGLKNTVTIFVWNAQELSVALYEGGKLVSKEFYPDSTSYTPTVTSLGIGNTLSKFRSSQVYHSVEPFTQQEINSLVEDPYQIFQSVSDSQDAYQLMFDETLGQCAYLGNLGSDYTIHIELGEPLIKKEWRYLFDGRYIDGTVSHGWVACDDKSTWVQGVDVTEVRLNDNIIAVSEIENAGTGDIISITVTNQDGNAIFGNTHYLTRGGLNSAIKSIKVTYADSTPTKLWSFDQWQQNNYVYDEYNRAPLQLRDFPRHGGFIKEVGVSDGVSFNGDYQYTEIPYWGAGNTTFDVYLEFTTNTLVIGKWMMLLGDRDAHDVNTRPVQIYLYSEGAVEVAFSDPVAGRQGLINTALGRVKSNARSTLRYSYDGTTATLDINDGEWVYTIEAVGFTCATGCRSIGRENTDILLHKATLIGDNGDNRLYDFTATRPNKEVPDIAYHADGVQRNGTLAGFDNVHLTDKITTLTGQKFDGETSASIPLWAAAGDFRIEGSFLFSPNIAIALGYTLDETNVIGCIETGAVRARYGGDSGNTKLDISGFTTDEVINFVFERIGDQTTFTANEVTTDPSTNTGTVYFDTIGAFFDPLQNFFDNVIGTLKLTEAGGDNREYDFKNRIIGSELIDNGVGAKHGVITGQLEHINADSYNEVIGYEFSGNSYMTFPRITLDGDFEINLSAIVLKNITQEVLIGSVQDGIDNMFIRIDTMDTLTVNLGGANSNQQKTFTFKSPILRGVIQDLRIARVGTVVTLTDFEGNSLTDDTWTDSDTTATFTGFAAKGIIPEFKFSGSLLKADISTETDSRSYDLTKESGTKILDVLGNQHATIINTPTSGFLPVIDRNVFTIGTSKDYGSLDDWFETEKLDATHYPIAEVYGSVAGMSGIGGMDNGFTVRSAKGQEFKGDFTDPDIAKITSACEVGVDGRIFKPTYENIMCHALDDFSNSYSIDLVIRNCGLLNQLTLDAPETKVNANNSVFVGSQAVQLDTSSQTHSFSDCIFVGNLVAAGVWGVINPIGDTSYPIQLTNCIGITNGTRFSARTNGVSCTNVLTNATEQLLGAEVDANVASYLLHSPVDTADIANTDARIDAANTAAMTALRYKGWNGTNICDWAYVEVVSGQLSLAVELSAIFDLYTAATAQQSTSADLLNAASHGQSTEADLYASVEIVHTTLMDAYSEVSTAQGTLVDLYNSANVSQTATVDLYQASEALQQTLQDLYSAVSVAQTTLMDLAEASRFFGEKQQSTLMDLCAAVQTVQNTLVDLYVSNSFGQTTLFDLYTLSAFSQSTLVNLNVSGQSTQSTLMGLYESVQVSQDTLMSLYGSVASTHNTFLDLYASLTKDHGTSVDLYSFSQVDQSALQDLYTYLGHEQVELNDLYVAGNQVQSTYVDLGEYELRVIAKRKITIQNTRYRFTVGNEFASIDLSKFNY